MRTVKTTDGTFQTTAFDFSDLKGKAREKALMDHFEFLSSVEVMDDEDSSELEYDEEYIIENIEANEYLFDLNGRLLPMTHYTGGHKLTGKHSIRIFGEEKMFTVKSI